MSTRRAESLSYEGPIQDTLPDTYPISLSDTIAQKQQELPEVATVGSTLYLRHHLAALALQDQNNMSIVLAGRNRLLADVPTKVLASKIIEERALADKILNNRVIFISTSLNPNLAVDPDGMPPDLAETYKQTSRSAQIQNRIIRNHDPVWNARNITSPEQEEDYIQKQGRRRYLTSANLLLLNDPINTLNSPTGEFVAGLENPIGVKLDPKMTETQVKDIHETLNPYETPGKIINILSSKTYQKEKLIELIRNINEYGADSILIFQPDDETVRNIDRSRPEVQLAVTKESLRLMASIALSVGMGLKGVSTELIDTRKRTKFQSSENGPTSALNLNEFGDLLDYYHYTPH